MQCLREKKEVGEDLGIEEEEDFLVEVLAALEGKENLQVAVEVEQEREVLGEADLEGLIDSARIKKKVQRILEENSEEILEEVLVLVVDPILEMVLEEDLVLAEDLEMIEEQIEVLDLEEDFEY